MLCQFHFSLLKNEGYIDINVKLLTRHTALLLKEAAGDPLYAYSQAHDNANFDKIVVHHWLDKTVT